MADIKKLTEKLTQMQRAFCEEYVIDFNATRAIEAAGSVATSKGSLNLLGCRLLSNVKIKPYLDHLIAERSDRVRVDATYVLEKLLAVVEVDLVKWADIGKRGADGELLVEMPEDIRKMVSSIERTDTTSKNGDTISRYKFKLMSKDKAIEMLGRHVGAFNDKLHIQADIRVHTITDLIASHSRDVTPETPQLEGNDDEEDHS